METQQSSQGHHNMKNKIISWATNKRLQHLHHNPNVRNFTQYVNLFCNTHNVTVIFEPHKLVDIGNGQMCNGYFYGDEETRDNGELAVATKKPPDQWLQILIHEFSHCLQWVENGPAWNVTYIDDEQDAYTMLQDWMTGEIDLDPEEAESCAVLSRMHEHDCDQRAVKLIEEWKLPINIDQYIQRSNAYHLFYNYIGETGKWYPEGIEPYKTEMIWKQMPIDWLDDYDNPPPGLMDLYYQIYGAADV